MTYLQEFRNYGKFKLTGFGSVRASEIEMYNLTELENLSNKDTAWKVLKPVKVLNYDDKEARAFAFVTLDCGQIGRYEKFMVSEPSYSHWRLYVKGLADFNNKLSSRNNGQHEEITLREVDKIDASLDGRLWIESKIIVLKSYADYEKRIPLIFSHLLETGVDIRDFNLLLPKLIPEIEDIDAGWRGIYSCKINELLT